VTTPTTTWAVVGGTAALSFTLKYLGYRVPQRWFSNPRAQRILHLLPIALLGALVAVGTFVASTSVVLDQRAAGLAAALVAVWRRAPFPVVVLVAAVTSALCYHLTS